LSVPLDVMRAKSPCVEPVHLNLEYLMKPEKLIDRDALVELVSLTLKSRKLVFLIGEGAKDAMPQILECASLLEARLITTPQGKSMVNPFHPLFVGVFGFAGHKSANAALKDSEIDTVFCIGTRLGEWTSNGWDSDLILNNRLVHIDGESINFIDSPMAKLHVVGHIKSIFSELLCALEAQVRYKVKKIRSMQIESPNNLSLRNFVLDDESAFLSNAIPIKPQRLMCELTRLLPPNTQYFADTGSSFAWAIHYLHPLDRRIINETRARLGQCFHTCVEFASMGWAIGNAIGSALVRKGQPVVCITGDGSVLMSGQEISVAVQEKLSVIFVVLNDSALGMVKHGQRLAGAKAVGTALPKTDFVMLANALGAQGFRIDSADDIQNLDGRALCQYPGPTVLDVRIDPEEVPPISMRMKVLTQ